MPGIEFLFPDNNCPISLSIIEVLKIQNLYIFGGKSTGLWGIFQIVLGDLGK